MPTEGVVEYWVEVPFKAHWSAHKAERQTMTYEGCEAGITIDDVKPPSKKTLDEIIGKCVDEIRAACLEDAEE